MWGNGCKAPNIPTLAMMEASHHFNDPTNSIQVQNPNTHWPGGWGGTQRQSWCNGETKNLSSSQRVNAISEIIHHNLEDCSLNKTRAKPWFCNA